MRCSSCSSCSTCTTWCRRPVAATTISGDHMGEQTCKRVVTCEQTACGECVVWQTELTIKGWSHGRAACKWGDVTLEPNTGHMSVADHTVYGSRHDQNSMYLCICVFVYMCICVSEFHVFVYLCICEFVYLWICEFVYLSIYQFVYWWINAFAYLHISAFVYFCIYAIVYVCMLHIYDWQTD